jgi:4-diphosphocytidyl-2-C-methyl-D-erythritol kinase
MTDPSIFEMAPAKINLALHVTGRRSDGYHLLQSIVTFTEHGDRLQFSVAGQDRFSLSGRFCGLLSSEPGAGNLVLRARDLLRHVLTASGQTAPPADIHLEKNLPVASGIGGGSADAAAALRGLLRLWQADLPQDRLDALALQLGADVPMCLVSRPLLAEGIGEDITPLSTMPAFAMVLANPLTGVSTPDIFRRLQNRDNPPIGPITGLRTAPDWMRALAAMRNDLEPPARALLPAIAEMSALLADEGASFVRMSGSGASCFGIFDSITAAELAAKSLSKARPDWYFQATRSIQGFLP